jgi:hypothetical protein
VLSVLDLDRDGKLTEEDLLYWLGAHAHAHAPTPRPAVTLCSDLCSHKSAYRGHVHVYVWAGDDATSDEMGDDDLELTSVSTDGGAVSGTVPVPPVAAMAAADETPSTRAANGASASPPPPPPPPKAPSPPPASSTKAAATPLPPADADEDIVD